MLFSDTVDFLKSISPRTLPGMQELQRRDLLHRASDLPFEERILTGVANEDDIEADDEEEGNPNIMTNDTGCLFLVRPK